MAGRIAPPARPPSGLTYFINVARRLSHLALTPSMGRSAAKNLPDPEAWPTVYYRSRKKRQSSRMKPSGFRLDVADKSEIFERHNSRGHSPPMPTEIKKEIALEIAHVLFIRHCWLLQALD